MRKLIATEFVTMDMVMEDPGGQDVFKDNQWHFPFWCQEISQFKMKELLYSDSMLLGRVTYNGFAEAWPKMEEQTGDFGVRMNNNTKYVVSKSLKKAEWKNSHIISDNVVEEIKKNKEEKGGNILMHGSATLFQFCIRNDDFPSVSLTQGIASLHN